MNDIQLFSNPDFGQIRTIEIDGETWFVATDVCQALEISNPTVAIGRLDDDERSKFNLGRQGDANIVNESGLYSLILGSRKPGAKAFKRWITHDVIPTIRKQGSYALSDDLTHLELPEQDGEIIQHRQLTLTEGIRIANLISSCSNDRLPLLLDTLELYGIALPEAEKLRKQIRAKSKGTDEDKERLAEAIDAFLAEHPDHNLDDLVDRLRHKYHICVYRYQLVWYQSKQLYPRTVGEADELIDAINDYSADIWAKQWTHTC